MRGLVAGALLLDIYANTEATSDYEAFSQVRHIDTIGPSLAYALHLIVIGVGSAQSDDPEPLEERVRQSSETFPHDSFAANGQCLSRKTLGYSTEFCTFGLAKVH